MTATALVVEHSHLHLRYEFMFCNTDSEELLNLVALSGGVGCLLQDTVHLAATVALPLIERQMQVRKLFANTIRKLTTLCVSPAWCMHFFA